MAKQSDDMTMKTMEWFQFLPHSINIVSSFQKDMFTPATFKEGSFSTKKNDPKNWTHVGLVNDQFWNCLSFQDGNCSPNFASSVFFVAPLGWKIWELRFLFYHNMGVSKNSGTPKSSMLIGFSIINHPFWGTTIFGNTHIAQQQLGGLGWLYSSSFRGGDPDLW